MHLYVIFDDAAGVYSEPVVAQSTSAMLRTVKQALATLPDDHPYISYPADYHVCMLGKYDERTADITTDKPQRITNFAALLQEVKR